MEVDVVEEDREVRLGGEPYFPGGLVAAAGEVGCCFEGVNGDIVPVELLQLLAVAGDLCVEVDGFCGETTSAGKD